MLVPVLPYSLLAVLVRHNSEYKVSLQAVSKMILVDNSLPPAGSLTIIYSSPFAPTCDLLILNLKIKLLF